MEHPQAAVASSTPVRTRIGGLDVARALAIIGMVMVHVGPRDLADGGIIGAAYRATHGRAAVGFVVLAGIGVSLLAGERTAARSADARRRLAWRATILLPAGLALQTLDVDVAVILQYYAAYFLVAAAAIRLRDRGLLIVAAVTASLGPALLILLERAAPELFQPGVPVWSDGSRILRDVLVTGYYPVVVWAAPLLVGMWIGRRDLRSGREVHRLLIGGAGAAAAGFLLSDALVEIVGPATSPVDWRQLFTIVPHNEMPLWLLTATGIAVAVTAACLLLAHRHPRPAWPLVALGQLALTAYVLHLVVLDVWPQWLERDTFASAWVAVGRFTIVALALATAYRAVAARGPFELLLRPPPPRRQDDAVDRVDSADLRAIHRDSPRGR